MKLIIDIPDEIYNDCDRQNIGHWIEREIEDTMRWMKGIIDEIL